MAYQITVRGGRTGGPVPDPVSEDFGANGAIVTNLSTSTTVYYGDESFSDTALANGSITAGGTVALYGQQYLMVASSSSVLRVVLGVNPLQVSVGTGTSLLTAAGQFYSSDYLVGGSDHRLATRSAVDAAVSYIAATSKPAVVWLPPGVLDWTTGENVDSYGGSGGTVGGVGLPVNLAARLVIKGAGRGVTKIKLTSSARSAFWIRKTADYDTFQNVSVEDFDVDCNNVQSRCHVVIGNIPGANTPQQRLNFSGLRVRNVDTYNVPVDLTQTTSYRHGVVFLGAHAGALEATQTTTTDVVIENCEANGGDCGFEVCSYVGATGGLGGVNHYYDRIYFRKLRHAIPSVATATSGQTSFYICGAGFGDYFKIEDCHSVNISDDAIEIGAMQRGEIVDCSAVDPYLEGILFRHTHALSRAVDQQKIIVRNFRVRLTTALTVQSGFTARPVAWIDDGTFTFGNFTFEDLEWAADGLTYSLHLQTTIAQAFDKDVRNIVLNRPKFVLTNYAYDSNTVQDIILLKVATPTAGNKVTIRDLDVRATGFLSSSTGNVFVQLLSLQGTSGVYAVDGFTGDFAGSFGAGGGGLFWLGLGRGGGTLIRADIRRFVPVSHTATGGSTNGIAGGSGTVASTAIESCDFTGPSWSNEITLTAMGATSQERVQTMNNTYKTPPVPSTVTVTASPFTYQNLTGRRQAYTITGGTVSKIEYGSKASSATFQDSLLTSGSFFLDPGSRLRVTHSVTPTMTNMPLS